ncbi:MAG: hypothetical protein WA705_30380 [Candidatus Ozemobacteraceae bacterium]
MEKNNSGQAIVIVILAFIVIFLILSIAFSGRMSGEMRLARMSHEEEAASFLAEACIEETIIFIRENCNVPGTPLYDLFREPGISGFSAEPKYAMALARECFSAIHAGMSVNVKNISLALLDDDLVENSLDRVGHVGIDAHVQLGKGASHLHVIKQFRVQDISTPTPFKKFGLLYGKTGYVWGSNGTVEKTPLSPDELNTINNHWRYSLLYRGSTHQMKGFPFVRQRLSMFFPSWQSMKEHLYENGELHFYGDVLSPDPLTLQFGEVKIAGVGRILSPDSNIVFNKTRIAASSTLGFGVLSGGAIVVDGFKKSRPANFSTFLPSGKLCLHDESGIKGFVQSQDLEFPAQAKKIAKNLSCEQPTTVVILSGQTVVWKNVPSK